MFLYNIVSWFCPREFCASYGGFVLLLLLLVVVAVVVVVVVVMVAIVVVAMVLVLFLCFFSFCDPLMKVVGFLCGMLLCTVLGHFRFSYVLSCNFSVIFDNATLNHSVVAMRREAVMFVIWRYRHLYFILMIISGHAIDRRYVNWLQPASSQCVCVCVC